MTKIITLYNHKGGVSKTTTTFNLAHYLVETGLNILIVDADPQCNITELVMAGIIDEADDEAATKGTEVNLPGRTLLDILKPRIHGDRATVDIAPADAVKIKDRLLLIRGDVSLSSIEESLAEAHIQRFAAKTHEKRTYVALADTLRRFGASQKIDYILIDVGPSSGALTRSCFLACDGFFVPTAPDRFNVQALGTLSTIIDRWISEHEEVYKSLTELGLPVFLGKPIFLGLILQSFSTYKGEPKKSFTYWIDKIPEQFDKFLLATLQKHSSKDRDLTGGLSGKTATSLLQAGILLRGGISYGKQFSSGSFIFSQALIESYRIEQSIADGPRVIVSNDLIDLLFPDRKLGKELPLIMEKDERVFVDYLGEENAELKKMIVEMWQRHHSNSKYGEKYDWLLEFARFRWPKSELPNAPHFKVL